MNIAAEIYGHAVILNLKGELTDDSISALDGAAERALENSMVIDLVLNFEAVPFMDSKALEFLLGLQDRLAEKLGQVRLLKCDENIRKILEITRLEGAFEVCNDVNEAVKSVQA